MKGKQPMAIHLTEERTVDAKRTRRLKPRITGTWKKPCQRSAPDEAPELTAV